MLMKLISGHPVAAGLLSILLLALPTFLAVSAPSSQASGLVMMLALPFQAITPLPIFLVSLKRGLKSGVIAALVLAGGAFFLSQELQFSLMVFLLLAAFPLLASWMLYKGWNFSQSAGSGFFLGLLILVVLLFVSAHTPLAMEKNLTTSLESIQERFVTMAQGQGADAKTILEHQQALGQFFHLLGFLFPAILVSGWYMLQLGNLVLTRYLFARWDGQSLPSENFAGFRVPFFMVWPVIGFGLVMLVADELWLRFSANISMFMAIPYFFQGWAIVQELFVRFKIAAFWRNLFYVIIFLSSKIALIIVLLGFFDTWLNFRHRFGKT
ncbi:MAG: hypothetical protein HW380_239 [Magnetococcales bacterium]|nr:hypothetical protein [Magnetococcales bacterium]HIJ84395.1 DUF2232 domain-containing protein [Magnetococcales bacterium]